MEFKTPKRARSQNTNPSVQERMGMYCRASAKYDGCKGIGCRECMFGYGEDELKEERERAFLEWEEEQGEPI